MNIRSNPKRRLWRAPAIGMIAAALAVGTFAAAPAMAYDHHGHGGHAFHGRRAFHGHRGYYGGGYGGGYYAPPVVYGGYPYYGYAPPVVYGPGVGVGVNIGGVGIGVGIP
jgi:hypothetical protein